LLATLEVESDDKDDENAEDAEGGSDVEDAVALGLASVPTLAVALEKKFLPYWR
jgi:hypothetical protein